MVHELASKDMWEMSIQEKGCGEEDGVMVDGTNATEMQRRIPQNMSSGDEGGKIEGRKIERNTRTDNEKDEQVRKGVNRTYLRCCRPQVHQYIHFPSKHLFTSSLNSRERTSTKTIQAFKREKICASYDSVQEETVLGNAALATALRSVPVVAT
ncbi:uncharacterized protein STEHIDRAFT_110907 [Stereum hirsutum FP-91666 SS1]|uniref:uncharacterized protein n=1 Tax=Stereum hirsutum (strain FP-91666) TaxID=721885 RepID=UPI000440C8B9|nr:uncharacterized protein STEHIDRAFT_110907 [Stereum hirsutum FP-91666 SS1]EIM86384.1 hypothetical protein STEHIDRAFT_110907 [Stereum hirsutum FP-91666 SS1]